MPSKNDYLFTLKKCHAKLVSVRLNEMKYRARTLFKFILKHALEYLNEINTLYD